MVAAPPTILITPSAVLPPPVKVMCPTPLVTVLRMTGVTLVPLHGSVTVGGSNDQLVPHYTVLLVVQTSAGGLHLPADPALKMLWTSFVASSRLNTSTSSMQPGKRALTEEEREPTRN